MSMESHTTQVSKFEYKYSFDSLPVRHSIRFEETDRPDTPTTSKICGTPYLPEHAPYPVRDGKPMLFIAQFNFEEFPPLPDFPSTGLLQLFVPNEPGWGGVFSTPSYVDPRKSGEPTQFARYIEDISAPHVGELPEEAAEEDDHPADDQTEATTIDGILTLHTATDVSKEFVARVVDKRLPHALLRKGTAYMDIHGSLVNPFFVVVRTVDGDTTTVETISATREDMQKLADDAVARAERDGYTLDPSAEDLLEPVRYDSADVTRLGGYPKWVNDCMLSPGDPEVLLATVSHGENIMFGDCGYGNFFIHPDDLAARNFDRVFFGWDCG